MTTVQQRLISFAGSTVAIEHSGTQAAAIVDFVYRDAPGAGAGPPCTTFRLTSDDGHGKLEISRDGESIYTGSSEAAAAELLMGDSCYHLAKESNGGLLFHAAALTWQGKGIVAPGGIGAGKTTLAAWLALQGLNYLTDEMVFVPDGATRVQAFTRPLNLKHPSKAALEDHIDFEGQAAHVLHSPSSYLVSPALLNPTNALSEPPIDLIIFPRYVPDSDLELHPLSKAEAGLALMQCLVNARNLPEHGFTEIARLAKLAPACRLGYSAFDQIEGRLEALLAQA